MDVRYIVLRLNTSRPLNDVAKWSSHAPNNNQQKGNDAMNQIMTPSTGTETTTVGQINKLIEIIRALLEKHGPEFEREAFQQALGAKGLATDLLAVVRRYVEVFAKMIVHLVTVDRGRTPEQAIAATGRKQYVTATVVAAMPKGTGANAKIIYWKPLPSDYDENGWISDDKLEELFAERHLTPVDPYSLAADNEADTAFADEHPNATHWKDVNGNWCYAAFNRWGDDERRVDVERYDSRWDDDWWFAGLAS